MAEAGQIKMPLEIHDDIAVANGPLPDWTCDAAIKKALILDEEFTRICSTGSYPPTARTLRQRSREDRARSVPDRLCAHRQKSPSSTTWITPKTHSRRLSGPTACSRACRVIWPIGLIRLPPPRRPSAFRWNVHRIPIRTEALQSRNTSDVGVARARYVGWRQGGRR
jgi:hypothetical protein